MTRDFGFILETMNFMKYIVNERRISLKGKKGVCMNLSEVYNNEQAIKEYVIDLKTLHEIINMRKEAGYKFGIRLNSLKLLNDYLWMDTCGNTMTQDGTYSNTYCGGHIPDQDDTCPYCGKGWDLHNIKDHCDDNDYVNRKIIFYHKECNRLRNLEEQRKEFIDIFSQIYDLSTLNFQPIPNEYDTWEGYAPWFIINTPDGDIKIGWRKRVINIEWLDTYKQFSNTFENEDVTRGFGKYGDNNRFIHAWGIEKCIEYLKAAKESMV